MKIFHLKEHFKQFKTASKVESVPLLEESISMTYLQNEEWTGEGASAGILHNTVITNLYDK